MSEWGRQRIAAYYQACGGPEADQLVADLLDAARHHELLETIADAVLTVDDPLCHESLWMLRDLGIMYQSSTTVALREAIAASGLLAIIAENLVSPGVDRRRAMLYTLGKLSYPGCVDALESSFGFFLARDPINLARWLFEYRWLDHRDRFGDMIWQAAQSRSMVARWSTLEVLESIDAQHASYGILLSLLQDPSASIAAEANYVVRAQGEPEMSFSQLELDFGRWCREHGRDDYTIAELEGFLVERGLT